MRAEKNGEHISGAEDIVEGILVERLSGELLARALEHPNGQAEIISIKVEAIEGKIKKVKALPVTTIEVDNAEQGWLEVKKQLNQILSSLRGGTTKQSALEKESGCQMQRFSKTDCFVVPPRNDNSLIEHIISIIKTADKMRGAIIYDIRRKKRVEPDQARGVRVSRVGTDRILSKREKNHFAEALTLASKASEAKGIIGEICVSDDLDYVTGYVASKRFGYVRITKLKKVRERWGGRIYLYDGEAGDLAESIDFLENTPVIVESVPNNPVTLSVAKDLALANAIESKKNTNTWRNIRIRNSGTSFDGASAVLMASNDYLGLSQHPEVKAVAVKAIKTYGTGAGASRLITGTLPAHTEFEKAIAKFKDTESAILFGSGYSANTGVIPAMADLGGVILSDELNHASIIDGCRLSKAQTIVYRHNDMADLEAKAKQYAGQGGLIVSDAVFSMDGDIVNLPRLLEIAEKYDYYLMIDEAHSTGVLGKTGRGITEHFGCRNPDIIMGTCGKALGSEGGFICGSKQLIEYLINEARSFIFSTAIAPAGAVSATKALEIISREPERIERLRQNIVLFCDKLKLENNQTPIIPIIIGDEKKAVEISDKLLKAGYYIPAIRYPTVAKGTARLRVALSSEHTKEQILDATNIIASLDPSLCSG